MTLHCTIEGSIAVLTIDRPPVNAIGADLRSALLAATETLGGHPNVHSVVLTTARKLFAAGADVSEFDGPLISPTLPEVIAAIETSPQLWIAAIRGMAFGGGLELSMACRYRIATDNAAFALPEINLGIVPGAGGTQRLPRLVGVDEAVAVAAENRKLDATTALRLGLVDRLVAEPLSEAAIAFAQEALRRPPPSLARDRQAASPGDAFWQAAEQRIARKARGAAAPLAALHAVRVGIERGFEEGLAQERATFIELRQSTEAAAMRRLFFAERANSRLPRFPEPAGPSIDRIGIVGAGLMGCGIAAAMVKGGYPVTLADRDDRGLARAEDALRTIFSGEAKRDDKPQLVDERLAMVRFDIGPDGMQDCELVVEAVFEDLELKQDVFAQLERRCHPGTILATNTSYLDPREIFRPISDRTRTIGLHFFSPAPVMKLLEVIPLPQTSDTTKATAHKLARRLGKTPVVAGICEGFIGNRMLRRYRRAAENLVCRGNPPAAVDAAMRDYGFAMGPFEAQDMAGLDIAHRALEAARAGGQKIPVGPLDLLVAAGRRGQKTGAGWYDYQPGERTPRPSAQADAILAPLMAKRPPLPPEEIARLLVEAMAEEGDAIRRGGVAASAADIDLVQVLGYGFPRHRGGPMFATGRLGPAEARRSNTGDLQ